MPSSDPYTTATLGAVLMLGRAPKWSTQADAGSTAPPTLASSGVAMENAVRALIHVTLRADPRRRTALLTIDTWDGAEAYNVRVNSVVASHDASGGDVDVEDTIEALVDAINTTHAGVVTATAAESVDEGGIDSILVEGVGEEDFSIGFDAAGAAELSLTTDLAHAVARLWWLPGARTGSTPPAVWASSGDVIDVDRRGHLERYDVAGLSRCFVQLSERAGVGGDGSPAGAPVPATITYRTPVISVGPCLQEL